MNQKTGRDLKKITACALFTAVLCILSPLAVPFGPVPAALGSFAVMLVSVVLPLRQAVAAVAAYLLLGAAGLPVFAMGKGGIAVLFGPTGGYLWAYLLMPALVAPTVKKKDGRENSTPAALCCIASALVCIMAGAAWYMCAAQQTFAAAVAACVLPFIAPEMLKAVCAGVLGMKIRTRLAKAGMLIG